MKKIDKVFLTLVLVGIILTFICLALGVPIYGHPEISQFWLSKAIGCIISAIVIAVCWLIVSIWSKN